MGSIPATASAKMRHAAAALGTTNTVCPPGSDSTGCGSLAVGNTSEFTITVPTTPSVPLHPIDQTSWLSGMTVSISNIQPPVATWSGNEPYQTGVLVISASA